MSTADVLTTILGALIEFNATPEKFMTKPPVIEQPVPPKTIKELIERHIGPEKPKFKIKRCKFPCERSA